MRVEKREWRLIGGWGLRSFSVGRAWLKVGSPGVAYVMMTDVVSHEVAVDGTGCGRVKCSVVIWDSDHHYQPRCGVIGPGERWKLGRQAVNSAQRAASRTSEDGQL